MKKTIRQLIDEILTGAMEDDEVRLMLVDGITNPHLAVGHVKHDPLQNVTFVYLEKVPDEDNEPTLPDHLGKVVDGI